MQDMFRTAEGRLGIDDPRAGIELSQEPSEVFRVLKLAERAVELELVLGQELLKPSDELTAEDAAQDVDRQQEARGCCGPARSVERETAARHDTVDMGMMLEVLSPGMQHAEQPDVSAKVPRARYELWLNSFMSWASMIQAKAK